MTNEEETGTDCFLEEIKLDEFSTLKFQTISGGQIYSITQQQTIDDVTKTVADFRFRRFQDSLAILDQLNLSSREAYMSVRFEENKPQQVVRLFSTVGVKLFHDITYFGEDSIRTDLSRLASTGDLLFVGYSVFHLNTDGNVVRNEQFVADRENPSVFTKVRDRTYTYDRFPSPNEDLYLPFFGRPDFAGVEFFSANNILSFSENNQTSLYDYEYGPDGNVVAQTSPMGQTLLFSYANCRE